MSTPKVNHYSDINLRVGLDETNTPVEILWQAQDNPETMSPQPCKALLLSIFDGEHKDTLKIDLWTSELQVMEMDRFMFQTLKGLADTYMRATNNAELHQDMQHFIQYFGERTEILPKTDTNS